MHVLSQDPYVRPVSRHLSTCQAVLLFRSSVLHACPFLDCCAQLSRQHSALHLLFLFFCINFPRPDLIGFSSRRLQIQYVQAPASAQPTAPQQAAPAPPMAGPPMPTSAPPQAAAPAAEVFDGVEVRMPLWLTTCAVGTCMRYPSFASATHVSAGSMLSVLALSSGISWCKRRRSLDAIDATLALRLLGAAQIRSQRYLYSPDSVQHGRFHSRLQLIARNFSACVQSQHVTLAVG